MDDVQIHRLQKIVSQLQAELNAVKSGEKYFNAEHLEMKLAEQQEQLRQQYEAKIRDITNIFSVSSLGFNFNAEPRELSVTRDKRRETWNGSTSATFGEFGLLSASRHIPGKSELVRSNLMSLGVFEPLEDDVRCVSEDRRSFKENVPRRSNQSIDPDCIFRSAFVEVEVQTEPMHDLPQMATSDELESRLADKDGEVEALKSELEQSKSETVKLQSQVESLKQALKSSPSREDVRDPQTGMLTAEVSGESSCGSVNSGGPYQSVNEQVGAVEPGTHALQLEVQQLTADLQASKSLLEKVMYENERLLVEADSARAEMEKSVSNAENWKCRVDDLQAEVEQLSADCQAWKQQLESREIETATCKQTIAAGERVLADHAAALHNIISKHLEELEELEELRSSQQVVELEKQFEDLRVRYNDLRTAYYRELNWHKELRITKR